MSATIKSERIEGNQRIFEILTGEKIKVERDGEGGAKYHDLVDAEPVSRRFNVNIPRLEAAHTALRLTEEETAAKDVKTEDDLVGLGAGDIEAQIEREAKDKAKESDDADKSN